MLYFTPITANAHKYLRSVCKIYKNVGLILSENQVRYRGNEPAGYLTDLPFTEYMKQLRVDFPGVEIVRDHFTQFYNSAAIEADAMEFDTIHLDPWKPSLSFDTCVELTINGIKQFLRVNPNLKFEIGTEYGRYPFTLKQFEDFLKRIDQSGLSKHISYVVVQSKEGLDLVNAINNVESHPRLEASINIANSFGFRTKQHNQDFVDPSDFTEKLNLGVNAFNVAPGLARLDNVIAYQNMNWLHKIVYLPKILLEPSSHKWINAKNRTWDLRKYFYAFLHYTDYDNSDQSGKAGHLFNSIYLPLIKEDENYSR